MFLVLNKIKKKKSSLALPYPIGNSQSPWRQGPDSSCPEIHRTSMFKPTKKHSGIWETL